MDPCKKYGLVCSPDPYQKFGLIYNRDDDTLVRLNVLPCTTTEAHNSVPEQPVFTTDIPLNTTHSTWIRLYKPINPTPDTKLPLILYFHGSGFIICSASDTPSHDFCTRMAAQLPAVILSLEYRLAPESRLPAAYEDAVEALLWIRNHALSGGDNNPIALNHHTVDFSRCYLMGTSAGGNIAYHAGLRALTMDLLPLVIQGYIFDHSFFGGLERSGSELRLANDPILSLADTDVLWELALPKGCNRDHEYCNPLVEGSYKDKIRMLGRCFVNMCGCDILVDYQLEFVKMLEGNGVRVATRFEEQGYHCMNVAEVEEKGKDLFAALKPFISP